MILIPNMIVSIIAGHLSDKYGRKNIAFFGVVLFGISCPIVSAAGDIVGLCFALALFGAANAVLLTPTLPEMADVVERLGGGAYASAYALFNVSYSGGMLVGPLFGGFLVNSYNFATQMLVFGLSLLAFSPVVLVFHIKSRKSSTPEVVPPL